MNSLSYLSRQLDVLATSGSLTPPSTPIKGSHLSTSERPQRAKSYSRIAPRRPSHQGQSSGQQSSSPQDGPGGGHTTKRSFSSPALWSFRKPTTLTPSPSIPPTPAPVLQRTTSYNFPNTPTVSTHVDPQAPKDLEPASELSSTPRPLLLRIFAAFWEVMYALWLRASGYLVVPSLFIPHRGGRVLGKAAEEVDTSGEESEDDGIVTRAPKRSLPDPHQPTDIDALSASFQAFEMSATSVITTRQHTFPPLDPPSFSLEPPSPEEVQERTETPRIDAAGTTMRDRKPSSTLRRRNEPSSSLLPNPLISSLVVKSGGGVSSVGMPRELQQQFMYQNQQHPPRKMQGVRMPKTLVLDLDETLIHSTSRPLGAHAGGGLFSMGGLGFGFGERRGREAGHMVEVVLGGRCTLYHVYKRPFVDYFLRKVC
jgi:CTD nuclear envelope phosphatase 1